MKYTSIQNMNEFTNNLKRFYPPDIKRIMEIECEVTEKIHGENFRVGKTADNRYFVGQKNLTFFEPDFESHPNWNKMSKNAKKQISRIHDYCKAFYDREITFYGELCGNGLQSGFIFPFDEYEVLYMDIILDGQYTPKVRTRDLIKRLHLMYVPYIGTMKLGHAIEMDVNKMPSMLCKNDYIEGIVVSPITYPEAWRLQSRLVLKIKTDKYSEQSKSKKTKGDMDGVKFQSTFADFITFGRFENVVSHCKETETVNYEMSDLKFLIKAMIADIEKECNDGQELSPADKKYLGRFVPVEYKKYLAERDADFLKESLNKVEEADMILSITKDENPTVTEIPIERVESSPKKRTRKKKSNNEE